MSPEPTSAGRDAEGDAATPGMATPSNASPHTPAPHTDPRAGEARAGDASSPEAVDAVGASPPEPVVDFRATARRIRRFLMIIGVTVIVVWSVRSIVDQTADLRLLAELIGIGALLAFAVEIVVVGGAALRGVIRAGERGDRLAADDVALLPPQLRNRRRR